MVLKLSEEAFAALLSAHNACPRRAFAATRALRGPQRRFSARFASAYVVSSAAQRCTWPGTVTLADRRTGEPCSRRGYATTKPPEIAVLGGGLTGLATAYYLTKFSPEARITLYEAGDRLGGWVHSEKLPVSTGTGSSGMVVFERGPRTVQAQSNSARYDDFALYELIDSLGLQSVLAPISKKDSSGIKRFLFYPDHLVDISPPQLDTSSLSSTISSCMRSFNTLQYLLTEPIFKGIIPSAWNSFRQMAKSRVAQEARAGGSAVRQPDVSIGEFFANLFGQPDLVNNVLSAMIHGIYGGDVWKLSVESSIFSRAWLSNNPTVPRKPGTTLVQLQDGELVGELLKEEGVRALAAQSMGWGYLNFAGGFGRLTDALAGALQKNDKVEIRLGEPVAKLHFHQSQRVEVHSGTKQTRAVMYDKVVSTLFSKTLASLCPPGAVPSLADSHAVTIQVVNLWYPKPELNSPFHGFGYLIPQSVPVAPIDQNPEAALGVLFDSDREAKTGLPLASRHADGRDGDTVPGTKLTVMLGGHHWDGLPPEFLPDAHEGAKLAQAVVQRHLGIPASERVFASAKLARECIPQHYVGHVRRMKDAHDELERAFRGKLAVAGGSYTAQGVLPSLRAGRDVAATVAGRYKPGMSSHVGDTGLARFVNPLAHYTVVSRDRLPYRYNFRGSK